MVYFILLLKRANFGLLGDLTSAKHCASYSYPKKCSRDFEATENSKILIFVGPFLFFSNQSPTILKNLKDLITGMDVIQI